MHGTSDFFLIGLFLPSQAEKRHWLVGSFCCRPLAIFLCVTAHAMKTFNSITNRLITPPKTKTSFTTLSNKAYVNERLYENNHSLHIYTGTLLLLEPLIIYL